MAMVLAVVLQNTRIAVAAFGQNRYLVTESDMIVKMKPRSTVVVL